MKRVLTPHSPRVCIVHSLPKRPPPFLFVHWEKSHTFAVNTALDHTQTALVHTHTTLDRIQIVLDHTQTVLGDMEEARQARVARLTQVALVAPGDDKDKLGVVQCSILCRPPP